jgi:peptidyl-tRNA hydrolase
MVAIVIPAHNEEENIADVLTSIKKYDVVDEVIVVDDGSTDRTYEIARKFPVKVLRNMENKGKGFSCIRGAKQCKSGQIVFIDADGQFSPKDIHFLLRNLDHADLVIGQRYFSHIPWGRRLTNRLSSLAVKKITGMYFHDVLCGFRAIKRDVFLKLGLEKNGYEFETEMIIKAAKNGFKIKTVPVSVEYKGDSKLSFFNGLNISFFLVKEVFKTFLSKIFFHRVFKMGTYKQVIILRKDLNMGNGKAIVQACHACVGALEKANKSVLKKWENEGQKKVVVSVHSLEELKKLKKKAEKLKLPCFLVRDAGLTELPPGTVTALAIGPAKGEQIDKVTGSLPLLD